MSYNMQQAYVFSNLSSWLIFGEGLYWNKRTGGGLIFGREFTLQICLGSFGRDTDLF